MSAPIRVKFLARTKADQDHALWLSLLPGRDPHYMSCKFIFDPDARDYDWLVVYEDLTFLPGQSRSNRAERLACPRENTLFITTEPTSIKIYGSGYLGQFGHVMTRQPAHIIKHSGHIAQTPPLRWYYGRPLSDDDNTYVDVDTFRATPPIPKTRQASTVCSNKQMTPTLAQRYAFSAHLDNALGDGFDWYGRGVRPISDKAEAMDAYRYHTAIENHVSPGHWTEKIADCYLAYCLPLYYGDPDIGTVFPDDSFITIDIFDFDAATDTIQKAITDNIYASRLPAITEARRRVIDEYNLMTQIAKFVTQSGQSRNLSKIPHHIYGRHKFRKVHPFMALRDNIQSARFKGRTEDTRK